MDKELKIRIKRAWYIMWVLKDPERMKIIEMLSEKQLRPKDIGQGISQAQATIANHITCLRKIGVLKRLKQKDGDNREVYYTVHWKTLNLYIQHIEKITA